MYFDSTKKPIVNIIHRFLFIYNHLMFKSGDKLPFEFPELWMI